MDRRQFNELMPVMNEMDINFCTGLCRRIFNTAAEPVIDGDNMTDAFFAIQNMLLTLKPKYRELIFAVFYFESKDTAKKHRAAFEKAIRMLRHPSRAAMIIDYVNIA